MLALEPVVLRHHAARRQSTPLGRHPFDVAAQFDFLGQQRVARLAVLRAFARKALGQLGQ